MLFNLLWGIIYNYNAARSYEKMHNLAGELESSSTVTVYLTALYKQRSQISSCQVVWNNIATLFYWGDSNTNIYAAYCYPQKTATSILFHLKRFLRTKWIFRNIWCNLKRFLRTKYCNVTVSCDLKAFPQYHMWRTQSPSFTWFLITWSIHMSAAVGRRPFAQVLRNSLSGHPPPIGCDTWTQVHTPCFSSWLVSYTGFQKQISKNKIRQTNARFYFLFTPYNTL